MRKCLYGDGLSVAFLGQDGAGKSTVSDEICKWLNWKIEAQRFYLGSGDHYFSIFKSLKTLLEGDGKIRKSIWAVINILDLAFLSSHNMKVVFKAKTYVNRGGIALFDRFPQMDFGGINDGPKIRGCYYKRYNSRLYNLIISFFSNFEERRIRKCVLYSPDIVIKLMLSPEESVRRKPEEDIDNVREKHEIIKQLSFPNSKEYIIDATMPYEEELVMIKRIIWDEILERSNE